MQSLNFKTNVKTYAINGDENTVIKINTTDYSLIDRIRRLKENIGERMKKYEEMPPEEVTPTVFSDADRDIRSEIDRVFGENVSQGAFGDVNCLSVCDDGSMLFENFLGAVVPVILEDLQGIQSKLNNHIEKYLNQAERLAP